MISGSSMHVSGDRFGAWVCGDRHLMAVRPDTLSGLPIGVQFMGPHGRDIRVLEISKAAFPILAEG